MRLTYEERQLALCALRHYVRTIPPYLSLTREAAEKLIEKIAKNVKEKP